MRHSPRPKALCASRVAAVGGFEVLGRGTGAEAASASAVDSLDDDGEPDPSATSAASARSVTAPSEPGATGASTASATARAPDLSPRSSIAAGGRTDPDQSGVDDGLREQCVLGHIAVAGVDGIGAGALGQGEDLVDVEVGLPGSGAVQQPRIVGEFDEIGVGSARVYTATALIPRSWAARMMRRAISPRLAMRTQRTAPVGTVVLRTEVVESERTVVMVLLCMITEQFREQHQGFVGQR